MKVANYTELRNNLKSCIDGVISDNEPLVINRSGNNGVVILSLDEYNAIKETEYIMSSPETMAAIRRGEEEFKNGDVYAQEDGESLTEFLKRMKRISCTK
jgi:antitoxin YefM